MLNSTNIGGPVTRWLETFLCNQYAEVFEKFGYTTLQQVCSLNTPNLLSMGVLPIDCDKIMENVSVLRQTLQLTAGSALNYSQSYDSLLGVGCSNMSQIQDSSTPSPLMMSNNVKHHKKQSKSKQSNKNNESYMPPPNVTITNRQYMPTTVHANTENAKQIANDILTMTKNTNLNTKYTCIPLNHQQQQQQPIQYNSNQQQQQQYWSKTNESSLNTPLKSLERLVSLPETQVIDPKSVVNDNNDSNCINYDFDYQQQQQQYKTNLKRLNSEHNEDLFNNKKSYSSSQLQQPQLQQPQQQQYYYNNTNYYLHQPPQQQEPYLCDQQNDYYYQESNGNNYEYLQHQNIDYNLQYNEQYNQPQQLQQNQQYYQHYNPQNQNQQQQQLFDINSGLM